MSPKELLYIEDALGHIEFMMCQCKNAETQLSDAALKRQAQTLLDGNRKLFNQFYGLI